MYVCTGFLYKKSTFLGCMSAPGSAAAAVVTGHLREAALANQDQKSHYCQEREIDQLLQFCMHSLLFFLFALVFQQNIPPKYAPPRKTNYTLKWKGGNAAPPIYLIFTLSRRGIFWLNNLH